jgi:hypothetical protein
MAFFVELMHLYIEKNSHLIDPIYRFDKMTAKFNTAQH